MSDYNLFYHSTIPRIITPTYCQIPTLHTYSRTIIGIGDKDNTSSFHNPVLILGFIPCYEVFIVKSNEEDASKDKILVQIKPFITQLWKRKDITEDFNAIAIKGCFEIPFTRPVQDTFTHISINPEACAPHEPWFDNPSPTEPTDTQAFWQHRTKQFIRETHSAFTLTRPMAKALLNKMVNKNELQLVTDSTFPRITLVPIIFQNIYQTVKEPTKRIACPPWTPLDDFHPFWIASKQDVSCDACGCLMNLNGNVFKPIYNKAAYCSRCLSSARPLRRLTRHMPSSKRSPCDKQ